MKEYYVQRNNDTYSLIAIDENGVETSAPIQKRNYIKDEKYGYILKLPANEMNRNYLSAGVAEQIADGGRARLGDKVSRSASTGTTVKTSNTKSWSFIDYLEPDELKQYNDLIKIATERHDKLINDPKYKLEMEIKKLEQQLQKQKDLLTQLSK